MEEAWASLGMFLSLDGVCRRVLKEIGDGLSYDVHFYEAEAFGYIGIGLDMVL